MVFSDSLGQGAYLVMHRAQGKMLHCQFTGGVQQQSGKQEQGHIEEHPAAQGGSLDVRVTA